MNNDDTSAHCDALIATQLGELARGLRQLGAASLASRADDLQRRALRGADVTNDLPALLAEHESYITFLEHVRPMRTACFSRGWVDLADECTTLMAAWERSTEETRLSGLQRLGARIQARLAGSEEHVPRGAERVVERQVLVRRCGFCSSLTPADLEPCRSCGAKV